MTRVELNPFVTDLRISGRNSRRIRMPTSRLLSTTEPTKACIMAQKTIHPTTHSIERFEQRVLPHLPDDSRMRMQKRDKIKRSLYAVARRADYSTESGRVVHIPGFFTVKGHPPIPLTLVIDTVRSTIITLYIAPLWENVGTQKLPKWRLCA